MFTAYEFHLERRELERLGGGKFCIAIFEFTSCNWAFVFQRARRFLRLIEVGGHRQQRHVLRLFLEKLNTVRK